MAIVRYWRNPNRLPEDGGGDGDVDEDADDNDDAGVDGGEDSSVGVDENGR